MPSECARHTFSLRRNFLCCIHNQISRVKNKEFISIWFSEYKLTHINVASEQSTQICWPFFLIHFQKNEKKQQQKPWNYILTYHMCIYSIIMGSMGVCVCVWVFVLAATRKLIYFKRYTVDMWWLCLACQQFSRFVLFSFHFYCLVFGSVFLAACLSRALI